MIASVEITSELVPYVVIAAAAIFAFGYFIGHRLGKIDGETETARWSEGRRRHSGRNY